MNGAAVTRCGFDGVCHRRSLIRSTRVQYLRAWAEIEGRFSIDRLFRCGRCSTAYRSPRRRSQRSRAAEDAGRVSASLGKVAMNRCGLWVGERHRCCVKHSTRSGTKGIDRPRSPQGPARGRSCRSRARPGNCGHGRRGAGSPAGSPGAIRCSAAAYSARAPTR
jgi:hypothetical protein